MGQVRIGTSGWAYKDWNGPFYPDAVKAKDRLAYVSRRFSTLEINASFYRTPTEQAVAAWRAQTPDDFLFAWKASGHITHDTRLADPAESLPLMLQRIEGLGDKIGPILFQLPPSLRRDDDRLSNFLKALPRRGRFVFEFRHPDWYAPAVLDLLREHGAALCISDHHHAPAPFEVTADFVYLRGHGPSGRYHGRYDEATLQDWAIHIQRWREAHDVFVYFDNTIRCAAPDDARRLIERLGRSD